MDQPAFIYDTGAVASIEIFPESGIYTATDILQPDELNGWKPDLTIAILTFDFGSATAINCFALAGDNLDGISVEVGGSTDNFNTSDVQVSAPAALSGTTAAWRSFTTASYRYWRIIFSTPGSAITIYHAVLQELAQLPYMDDGVGITPLTADSKALVSEQGYHLGTVVNKVQRKFKLKFGQVDDTELAVFTAWAEAVIPEGKGFFFIPDTAASGCYFGILDDKFNWDPTADKGLHKIPTIPFTSRYRS